MNTLQMNSPNKTGGQEPASSTPSRGGRGCYKWVPRLGPSEEKDHSRTDDTQGVSHHKTVPYNKNSPTSTIEGLSLHSVVSMSSKAIGSQMLLQTPIEIPNTVSGTRGSTPKPSRTTDISIPEKRKKHKDKKDSSRKKRKDKKSAVKKEKKRSKRDDRGRKMNRSRRDDEEVPPPHSPSRETKEDRRVISQGCLILDQYRKDIASYQKQIIELERQLESITQDTKKDVEEVKRDTEQAKDRYVESLRSQDHGDLLAKNQHIIAHLRKENSRIRTQNEQWSTNCSNLRENNIRLEANIREQKDLHDKLSYQLRKISSANKRLVAEEESLVKQVNSKNDELEEVTASARYEYVMVHSYSSHIRCITNHVDSNSGDDQRSQALCDLVFSLARTNIQSGDDWSSSASSSSQSDDGDYESDSTESGNDFKVFRVDTV